MNSTLRAIFRHTETGNSWATLRKEQKGKPWGFLSFGNSTKVSTAGLLSTRCCHSEWQNQRDGRTGDGPGRVKMMVVARLCMGVAGGGGRRGRALTLEARSLGKLNLRPRWQSLPGPWWQRQWLSQRQGLRPGLGGEHTHKGGLCLEGKEEQMGHSLCKHLIRAPRPAPLPHGVQLMCWRKNRRLGQIHFGNTY